MHKRLLSDAFKKDVETEAKAELQCNDEAEQCKTHRILNAYGASYFRWKEHFMAHGASEADAATIAACLLEHELSLYRNTVGVPE